MKATALHKSLALALQFIEVHASDLSVQFQQTGTPGPRKLPGSHMEGRDGLALAIRDFSLVPQGVCVR